MELIAGAAIFVVAYLIGNINGWISGRESMKEPPRHPRDDTDNESPLCKDYSHLKRRAAMNKARKSSVTHTPKENVCEKIYDTEVVCDLYEIKRKI